MSNQKTQTQRLHNSVNHAIIKCHRVYSRWARTDLLPRQTMNNIVAALCQEGLLTEASPSVKAGKRPACSLAKKKAAPFCCKSHRRSCWRGWGWVFVLRMRGVAP